MIDPETDEPVGYGEHGERVVTSFGRGFIPVLRYRTARPRVQVPADTLHLRARPSTSTTAASAGASTT